MLWTIAGCTETVPTKVASPTPTQGDTQATGEPEESGTTHTPDSGIDSGIDSGTREPEAPQRAPSIEGLPRLTVLPIEGAVLDSGFGPRRVSSEGYRTDFHPGIDLDAPLGTPVVAVADGVVHRVDRSDPDGDTLVILHTLETPVLFHGASISEWYARYLHLQTITVNEGDPVSPRTIVGTVGQPDDVVDAHLHFEVRLGTWCSLAYSVENPDSGCARDYDPAINPLHLLPLADPTLFTATIESNAPWTVRITVDEGDFDLNRLEVGDSVLDFDLRTGIDARTAASIDQLDYGWVRIDPIPDADEPDQQSWRFVFAETPDEALFFDIEGNGLAVSAGHDGITARRKTRAPRPVTTPLPLAPAPATTGPR